MGGVAANTHVVVGGNDFCVVLDNDIRGHSLSNAVPSQSSVEADGVDHIDMIPHVVSTEFTTPVLYYSDLTKALAGNRHATVFAIWDGYTDVFGSAPAVFEGGRSVVDGVPLTAPSTDAISNAFTVRPQRPWIRGSKAYPFSLSRGSLSFRVPGTFTNSESVFVVVTTKAESDSRTLTLTAGTKSATGAFTVPAIAEYNVTGFDGGNLTGATLATTGLGNNETVGGYLLIGSAYERPA